MWRSWNGVEETVSETKGVLGRQVVEDIQGLEETVSKVIKKETKILLKGEAMETFVMSESANINSVQFSHLVMSNSLRPYESQNARPPCPSPTPGVYSNSWPSSW